ncbi:MAG: UDP-glucose 4-epimerase [Firmicutes bacterium]|nr:UDP-glucose 4-epimerase [Bacillota bacterium]
MKIAVTGGAGFIGSHVVEKLLAEGIEPIVIDNLSSGRRENIPAGASFVNMDVRSKTLRELFALERFDGVVHLAAQTMVPQSLLDPGFDCDVNIQGTINVLEACREGKTKRIVFSSSAAVYGDADTLPLTEKSSQQPTSFYGLSKLTAEKYLELYYRLFGMEYVVLRYANVYGERQGDGGEGGVVSIFSRLIRQDKSLTVFGDGGQTRDFIYVGDVASANYKALLTENPNAIYNISTGLETSVNDLIAVMEEAAAKPVARIYASPREGDIYRSRLDCQAALTNLGWKPFTLLSNGIQRTYQSLGGIP